MKSRNEKPGTLYIVLLLIIFGAVIILIRIYVKPLYKTENETTKITLSSIVCDTCVSNVEKALNEIDGVIRIDVFKKARFAAVVFNSKETSLSELENAITKAGYDANKKKADIKAFNALSECCKRVENEDMQGNHEQRNNQSCTDGCCND